MYVIYLGDPFQLPPIDEKADNHLLDKPHIFLDEIHRQAQESEIIRLSMDIREQKPLTLFDGKDVKIIGKNDLVDGMLLWADQVLCAKNATRASLNRAMRELEGYDGDPKEGDKIICLRNYWETLDGNGDALINGTIGRLGKNYSQLLSYPYFVHGGGKFTSLRADFETETGSTFTSLNMDKKMILSETKSLTPQVEYALAKNRKFKHIIPKEFAYGYAITCHKAQGSQWPNVLVIEENFPFDKTEHARWLYTAITRAENKCIIVKQ